MKEILRRRITVTSSSNELSTNLLGNKVAGGGGAVTPPSPPLIQYSFCHKFKDDVNGISSISDICFMELRNPGQSADAE
jgi:hypothetical protein